MKQLAPDATCVPQLLVSAKSPASVPVIAMPVIFTTELPLFVSVIFMARLRVPTGPISKQRYDVATGRVRCEQIRLAVRVYVCNSQNPNTKRDVAHRLECSIPVA
jgi:hypothetical protein